MFRFKMLTKVLVAVWFFGQLIELNVNICIALSIERARPINRVKLYKTTQFQGRQMLPNLRQSLDEDPIQGHLFAASRRKTSSILPKHLQRHLRRPELIVGHQVLESTGRHDFFGTIEVGTPGKLYLVMFDTTSSEFWLPSINCESEKCISRMKYNSGESSTYRADGRKVKLQMGDISLEGHLSRDRIKFANFELDDVTFAEADKLLGDKLARTPVDGYFGLGFGQSSRFERHHEQIPSRGSSGTSDNVNETTNGDPMSMFQESEPDNGTTFAKKHFEQPETPIELMVKRGLIKRPIFSLYLNGENDERIYSLNSGELILGDIDERRFDGQITYVPVHSPQPNYWEFRLGGMELRQPLGETIVEVACQSGCPAIIDTGSKLIAGHFHDIDRINRQLGAIPMGSDGIYVMTQCDFGMMPDLVFTIGEAEFKLKPKDYILTTKINDQIVECYSSLRAISAEQYPFWILGEQFLKRHYVVFDYGEKRIGFASTKRPSFDDSDDEFADGPLL